MTNTLYLIWQCNYRAAILHNFYWHVHLPLNYIRVYGSCCFPIGMGGSRTQIGSKHLLLVFSKLPEETSPVWAIPGCVFLENHWETSVGVTEGKFFVFAFNKYRWWYGVRNYCAFCWQAFSSANRHARVHRTPTAQDGFCNIDRGWKQA